MIQARHATWPAASRQGSQGQRRRTVEVAVPGRLHLGLLDLEGGLGRRFGSLGVTLEGPSTRLTASPSRGFSAEGPDAARVERYLLRTAQCFRVASGCHVRVEQAIPSHSGLGSGTQLALASGTAACRLAGVEATPRAIAQALDRGARSGIGIGAFEQGGVLLDGGRGKLDRPPPLLCRLPFPDDWRILLILDEHGSGLHGSDELEAFEALAGFPAAQAAHLCRLVLMQALPALAEGDIAVFGAAVTELQRVVGDYFAPAQGGRFASPRVAEALGWLERQGVPGLGQSSWGPTGFALLGSEWQAQRLAEILRARGGDGLAFLVCRGRNSGATIVEREAAAAANP